MQQPSHSRKSLAALTSVVWSGVLTALKLIVGIATGSLGILSEALHSLLDLLAALGTLFAVKLSAKPADSEHPYGHGRAENLMALAETLLLLATAGWVVREAVLRLISNDPAALHIRLSPWAFVIIIFSLAVDINRSAILRRVARDTNSPALEADAAHFSSDILSSAAVLVGISCAALAEISTPGSSLHWFLVRADVFSSLAVAVIILHICCVLGSKSINTLMDKVDPELFARLRKLMAEQMPAYPLRYLRLRTVGDRSYIEMTVGLPRELHVDTAHEIADAIERLVASHVPGAETLVHMHPEDPEDASPHQMIRRIAISHRLGVHGLRLFPSDQGLIVFTDIELPPDATLGTWAIPVQAFRAEVRRCISAQQVYTHLEPDIRTLKEFSLPIPDDWEQQVRRAMAALHAPSPTTVRLYTHGRQRVCFISITPNADTDVTAGHERLSLISEQLTAALPPVAHIIVVYD